MLGHLGAIVGGSWAVMDAVNLRTFLCQKCTFSKGSRTMFACWGPLGGPLEALLELLGGV
eukprot:5291092-Pyramimonas_sp.AAC.1